MADPWQAVQLFFSTATAWSGVCAINDKVKKTSQIGFIRAQYPLACIISDCWSVSFGPIDQVQANDFVKGLIIGDQHGSSPHGVGRD